MDRPNPSQYSKEQLDKIDNFIWYNDEPSSDVLQPEFSVSDSILECAEFLCNYMIETMSVDHHGSSMNHQHVFSIPVPRDKHPLIAARFDAQYDEYSRCRVFDLLRCAFKQKFVDSGFQQMTTEKVQQIFPQENQDIGKLVRAFIEEESNKQNNDGRLKANIVQPVGIIGRQFKVTHVDLFDEPVVNVSVISKISNVDISTGEFRQANDKQTVSKHSTGDCVIIEVGIESRFAV